MLFGLLGLRKAFQMPQAKGTGHAIAGIVLGIIDLLAQVGYFFVLSGPELLKTWR